MNQERRFNRFSKSQISKYKTSRDRDKDPTLHAHQEHEFAIAPKVLEKILLCAIDPTVAIDRKKQLMLIKAGKFEIIDDLSSIYIEMEGGKHTTFYTGSYLQYRYGKFIKFRKSAIIQPELPKLRGIYCTKLKIVNTEVVTMCFYCENQLIAIKDLNPMAIHEMSSGYV